MLNIDESLKNILSFPQRKVSLGHFSGANEAEASPCNSKGCSGICKSASQMLDPLKESDISLDSARLYIEQMDLHYIVEVMCSPTYPLQQWTLTSATHCAKLYKNFLLLQKKHFPHFLVPSRAIDEFWHNHILYTKKYFQDCSAIFGHYLHHEPATGGTDSQQLNNDYLQTKQFYLAEFGTSMD